MIAMRTMTDSPTARALRPAPTPDGALQAAIVDTNPIEAHRVHVRLVDDRSEQAASHWGTWPLSISSKHEAHGCEMPRISPAHVRAPIPALLSPQVAMKPRSRVVMAT